MDNCEKYIELISASLDGALSPAEAADLEAHLAVCPDCRALARELKDIHEAMGALPSVEVPAGLHDRIMAAVAADNVVPLAPGKKTAHWKRWMASAAVLALVLLGAGQLGAGQLKLRTAKEAAPQAPQAVEPAAPVAPPLPKPETADAVNEPAAAGAVPVQSEFKLQTFAVEGADIKTATVTESASADRSQGASPTEAPSASSVSGAAKFPAEIPVPPQGADDLAGYDVVSVAGEPVQASSVEAPLPSPRSALERLLEEKGFGDYESLDGDTLLVTWPREGQAQDFLTFDGTSENGRYYLFVSYRHVYPSETAEAPDHSSRNCAYAVPLEGGEILEESSPDFWDQMKN